MIRTLKEKIKTLENELINLNSQFEDTVDKFNQDIFNRTEDLNFYKNSLEEQKSKVNNEHDVISSCLYELALQFITLKNEITQIQSPSHRISNHN